MIYDPVMAWTMIAAVFLPMVAMFAISVCQIVRNIRYHGARRKG